MKECVYDLVKFRRFFEMFSYVEVKNRTLCFILLVVMYMQSIVVKYFRRNW